MKNEPSKYSFFFLRGGRFFKDGTLFELEETADGQDLRLPDIGNGRSGLLAADELLRCPPFAENVPPGRCPVLITAEEYSFSGAEPLNAFFESNLHFQKIGIPFSDTVPQTFNVTVENRLKNFEADSYQDLPFENGNRCFIHIGHLAPGFYEIAVKNGEADIARVKFIKFFPPEFEAKYPLIKDAVSIETIDNKAVLTPEVPVAAQDLKYPADVLNHALSLATEWGENFQKPIDGRLLERFLHLSKEDVAELIITVKAAESYIYSLAEQELSGDLTESRIISEALKKYPWLEQTQVSRLKNIGMFYARK